MDFIEKIFGYAPDQGSGTFEIMLFLIPIVIITIVVIHKLKRLW
jgi:hypothetical protein